jgi:hypothetical protein
LEFLLICMGYLLTWMTRTPLNSVPSLGKVKSVSKTPKPKTQIVWRVGVSMNAKLSTSLRYRALVLNVFTYLHIVASIRYSQTQSNWERNGSPIPSSKSYSRCHSHLFACRTSYLLSLCLTPLYSFQMPLSCVHTRQLPLGLPSGHLGVFGLVVSMSSILWSIF